MNPVCIHNRVMGGVKRAFFNINGKLVQKVYWSSNTSSSSSSSSSSSDDDKKNKKEIKAKSKKNEDALNRLNNLLKTMIEEDVAVSKSKLKLAKPLNKRKPLQKTEEEESVKVELTEKQIIHAVKNVAETIGGDTKQTESELLMKLLNTSDTKSTSNNLTDLVKGMKVDREGNVKEKSRAQEVREILQQEKPLDRDFKKIRPRMVRAQADIPLEKIDLFGSEPLGIFTDLPKDVSEGVQNETWSKLYERDLKLAITHPPRNYFQQMILWTEQGKVWRFPIDNEQDLEEEKKVYFTEHVFLEKHLEPWCPQKGPIRHFMELVCVGLSKNPYLTVEAKKEHIDWFKNYFEEKKQLLKEVGALQETGSQATFNPKQIE